MSSILNTRRATAMVAARYCQGRTVLVRCLSSSPQPYYKPTLVPKRPNEAGPGGRGSESDVKVAVFGASGFLGNYFCYNLGSSGFMAYLANRGDDMEMRHLKVNFELGRSRFVFYSPRDRDSIKEVIANADIVVNLIGKRYESKQPVTTSKFPYLAYQTNYSYEDTNVVIPRTLAEICYEMQVDHFVHVSSASASPDSNSEWSRTKYEGELAVKEVYPWATIIRPTQMFGKGDFLLNWFANMGLFYGRVPLVNGGKNALTQPVYVNDVAKVLLAVCDSPQSFEGRQIDCFGPTDYSYHELAEFVNDITEQDKPIVNVPYSTYKVLAKAMQYTRDKLIVPDLVEQWNENFLPSLPVDKYAAQPDDKNKILTLSDFGIKPTPIEREAFGYLFMYRYGGHYYHVKGYH